MSSDSSGVWNDSGLLVIDTSGAVFPPRCVVTNTSGDLTQTTVHLEYDDAPGWTDVVFLFVAPMAHAASHVVHMATTDRAFAVSVNLPVAYSVVRMSLLTRVATVMVAVGFIAF